MKLSQKDMNLHKKLCLLSALSFAVLYALYCFVISPLYAAVASDVVLGDTILNDLMYYLGRIAELLAISVSYGAMIYGIYRLSLSKVKALPLIFLVATLLKYTANMAVSWIMSGGASEEWIWDIINVFFYTFLEAIQLCIVLLVINSVIKKQKQIDAVLAGTGKEMAVYPFRGVYDKKNCLMKSALLAAIIVLISKIFGQVVSDLYYIIASGLPEQTSTVILMLVTYLSNLIFCVVCYIAVIFTVMKVAEKDLA